MLGEESPYSTICQVFSELAFQNSNYEHSLSSQEQNMIEVRVSHFIFEECHQFLSSFSNHLLTRRNLNRTWSIEVNIVFIFLLLFKSNFFNRIYRWCSEHGQCLDGNGSLEFPLWCNNVISSITYRCILISFLVRLVKNNFLLFFLGKCNLEECHS